LIVLVIRIEASGQNAKRTDKQQTSFLLVLFYRQINCVVIQSPQIIAKVAKWIGPGGLTN
jgi:hypothetical protein